MILKSQTLTWRRFLGLLVGVIVLGLACRLGPLRTSTTASGHLPPTSIPPTPSWEASLRLRKNFNQTLQEASPERASQLRVSGDEITSLVALELAQQASLPLSEPKIWFAGERIYLAGRIDGVGPAKVPALIVARPAVNGNGQLLVQIESARMSHFDLSTELIERLNRTINETLAELQADIYVEAVEISKGEFIVTVRENGP